MLRKFTFGREYVPNSGGDTRPAEYVFDPTKVIALRPRTMGRTDCIIMFEGGHTINVDAPVDMVYQVLEAAR